ncbi:MULTISPECIES: hypothetical protein [Empedobacter]|uniref:hypothetical protein n=2 Tax=Weeksellaceae TaxID=2762318 RepID=UPI001C588599|nr:MULTISPECIES: hypothetical protein [Empedobacter]MBW1617896.1 hypothetical protein [Empedobacter falsenii]MDM1138809.1 hypothetical protein [Empedobacter sp. R132-2]
MNNLYTKSGGLIIGSIRMSSLLAQINIYEDKLIINYLFFFKIILLKKDIIDIIPSNDFFEKGIKILHKNPKYDSKIIFRVSNPDKLIEEIKKTGFMNCN